MKPLDQLTAELAHSIDGVIVDFDGLLLGRQRPDAAAYAALSELADAGMRVVACTARPAAWGEALQQSWPLDLTVSENGALAHARNGGRLERVDRFSPAERGRRRGRLLTVVEHLRQRRPALQLADDNLGRVSDVTFVAPDGEPGASEEGAGEARSRELAAREHGARWLRSPGRLHLTLDTVDKASGTLFALARAFGEDESRAVAGHAFVGSGVDAGVGFASFRLTFGVGTQASDLAQLTVGPRFSSAAPGSCGLVEVAARLKALRS